MTLYFVFLGPLVLLYGAANAEAYLQVNVGPDNKPHIVLGPSCRCDRIWKLAPLATKNYSGPYIRDPDFGKIRLDETVYAHNRDFHIPEQPTMKDDLPLEIRKGHRLYKALRGAAAANRRLCDELLVASAHTHPSDCIDTCTDRYLRHQLIAQDCDKRAASLRCGDYQQIENALKVGKSANRAADLLSQTPGTSSELKHYWSHNFASAPHDAIQDSNEVSGRHKKRCKVAYHADRASDLWEQSCNTGSKSEHSSLDMAPHDSDDTVHTQANEVSGHRPRVEERYDINRQRPNHISPHVAPLRVGKFNAHNAGRAGIGL